MTDTADLAIEKPFFIHPNSGFSQAGPGDDLLHPNLNALAGTVTVGETQYFGFQIPEHNIHCMAYLWHHHGIRSLTGGIGVWRGPKRRMLEAELHAYNIYAPDVPLQDDLHEFRLENGYGVRVIEPMKRFALTYSDPLRGNMVDVEIEAVAPAVMWADGRHFEQTMRVRGELRLRGERYEVDSFNVRDRSWGKARPENNLTIPPITWMSAVFDEDFSFGVNIFDHKEGNPELGEQFVVAEDKRVVGGWIYRGGEVRRIVAATKSVQRDLDWMMPRSIAYEMTDDAGGIWSVKGRLLASCPWKFWANYDSVISLMEWECDGRTGYGDCQEAFTHDYLNFIQSTRG